MNAVAIEIIAAMPLTSGGILQFAEANPGAAVHRMPGNPWRGLN